MKFGHPFSRKVTDGRAASSGRTWPVAAMLATAAIVTAWQAFAAESAAPPATQAAQKVSPAEAEGIIFERQQIMLQLDKDAEKLGNVVAGLLPADQLAATTAAIAKGAKESIAAFEPNAPGGRAKDTVWSNWADYSQRMQSFAEKSAEMAKVAETGDVAAVTSLMGDAVPCKQCHDVYREKKKSEAKPDSSS
jgi:cytochrome c556